MSAATRKRTTTRNVVREPKPSKVVEPVTVMSGKPVKIEGVYGKETGWPKPDVKLKISSRDGWMKDDDRRVMIFYLRDGVRGIHYYGSESQPHLLLVRWSDRGMPWAAAIAVPIGRVFYA